MSVNNQRPIQSIQQIQHELQTKSIKKQIPSSGLDFQSVLQQQLQNKEPLKFSKHASLRLDSRNIQLSDEQMAKLEQGVKKAESKGIRESLMLMDDIALVVNIENKTVVTALNNQEAKEHIFTNIDGAVLL